MKIKKGQINTFLVLVFVAIFPILPNYFRIGDLPVSYYFTLLTFVLTIITGKIITKKLLLFIKVIIPLLFFSLVSYVYFGEFESLLGFIISSIIPIFIVYNYAETKDNINKVFNTICFVGIIMCLSSLIERTASWNIFSLLENYDVGIMGSTPYVRDGMIRIEQSFGHSIPFAIYLSLINIISFYKIKTGSRRLLYIISYALSFICCFLTLSRMPFVVLMVCELLMFFQKQKHKIIVVFWFAIVGLIVNILSNNAITDLFGKYFDLINGILFSKNKLIDSSTLYRLELYPTLLPYIKNKILFGYGIEYMNYFRFHMFGYTYYSIDSAFLYVLMCHGLCGLLVLIHPIIISTVFSIKLIKKRELFGAFFLIINFCYFLNLFSVAQMGEKSLYFILVGVLLSFVSIFEIK